MTLQVVSRLHLHASPDSTSRVETVHPLVMCGYLSSISVLATLIIRLPGGRRARDEDHGRGRQDQADPL